MTLKHIRLLSFLALLVLFLPMPLSLAAGSATADWLITPEEAQLQRRSESYTEPVAAAQGAGPLIVLKNPKMLTELRSPIDILVIFEPGISGKPANMKTIEIRLVGWVSIDITERLRKYIKGNILDIEEAKLPTGRHRLRVSIKDVDGNSNERELVVRVLEKAAIDTIARE